MKIEKITAAITTAAGKVFKMKTIQNENFSKNRHWCGGSGSRGCDRRYHRKKRAGEKAGEKCAEPCARGSGESASRSRQQ